ncbi:hypothetical protein [Sinisalibacter lacisalsi]|uniref:Lipoprotein n=1 Tax=Sinisalibacter lacisalsi TaxID=1526570 RepID=A0ABQ1QQG6_9RHOB|nr:hypothetical protein [Sinisalibacter lacisalsi]GGD39571.1 hypothetical protein GCM10011358_24430 [Sinisalibacter lacisalsi]
MKIIYLAVAVPALAACAATPPVLHHASANGIAVRYEAYDEVLTLTPEAREIAVQHCAKFGKYANYKGGNAVSPLSAEEIHTFACEATKTDDSAIIAAQSVRPTYIPVPVYQPYAYFQ